MSSVVEVEAKGWRPDPSGRYEWRYWDGGWTNRVHRDSALERAPTRRSRRSPGPRPRSPRRSHRTQPRASAAHYDAGLPKRESELAVLRAVEAGRAAAESSDGEPRRVAATDIRRRRGASTARRAVARGRAVVPLVLGRRPRVVSLAESGRGPRPLGQISTRRSAQLRRPVRAPGGGVASARTSRGCPGPSTACLADRSARCVSPGWRRAAIVALGVRSTVALGQHGSPSWSSGIAVDVNQQITDLLVVKADVGIGLWIMLVSAAGALIASFRIGTPE